MQLIADSGSTKTTWCVADKGSVVAQRLTGGMNPFFQSEEEMRRLLAEELLPGLEGFAITQIFFYGAGCAFPEQTEAVRRAVLSLWNGADVRVESDLVGAAHSLCGDEAGIACILGTGSNSCLYDGRSIRQQVSPLGFILGDEGSGAVLGRRLVGDCLKRQMPARLAQALLEAYDLTPERILEKVYRQPFPNRFLASLVPFIRAHIDEEAMRRLVDEEFTRFFRRNVMMYTGYERLPVHFAGSVAYHFRDILQAVAQRLSLQLGRVEASPLDGLVEFYRRIHRPL